MAKIKLGQTVKDTHSGIVGLVVGRTEWLFGCIRLTIQPPGVKDGIPYDMFVVDEPQVEIVRAAVKDTDRPYKHGPRDDAERRSAGGEVRQ